ncbi:MAG: hypothetical protein HKN47_00650 [Pirellulaceae bacterium]|nr:hypothetical protein [Pirellulaceae bacterium]
MTNVKCSACGTVWDVNNPVAAKRPSKTSAKSSGGKSADEKSSGDRGKTKSGGKNQTTMIAIAGGSFAALVIAGISVVLLTGGDKDSANEPASQTAVAEPAAKPTYRVVDLPESTRKKIYSDYRKTASSSVEKKLMIPKDSIARQTVEKTMGALVAREVTHFSLLYNISEDDVMQIVAEGDAENWPGKKKEPATPE